MSNVKHRFEKWQHVVVHQIGPIDGQSGVVIGLTDTRDIYPMATVRFDGLFARSGKQIVMNVMESSLSRLDYKPTDAEIKLAIAKYRDMMENDTLKEWTQITPDWYLHGGDSGPYLVERIGDVYTNNVYDLEVTENV